MNILPLERAIVPTVSKATPAMSLTDRFAQAWLESSAQLESKIGSLGLCFCRFPIPHSRPIK